MNVRENLVQTLDRALDTRPALSYDDLCQIGAAISRLDPEACERVNTALLSSSAGLFLKVKMLRDIAAGVPA
jgi:hypothetical protein